MRADTGPWSATCGVHIGHHHASKGQNNQDAVALNAWRVGDTPYVVGIVCDGCGGAHEDLQKIGLSGHSEVGANLLADMMIRYLMSSTQRSSDIDELLLDLFDTTKRFISTALWTCPTPEESALIIQRFWLSTIVGFIMDGQHVRTFSCGDGVILVRGDEDVTNIIDQGGAPHYLAYACCPRPEKFGITLDVIPEAFQVSKYELSSIQRFMVATDGWTAHNLHLVDLWAQSHPDEDLPEDLDGLQWGKKGKFGLKKWMNTRFTRGYWNDDCGIVTVERKDDS